jgi:putative signal transducing protein
VGLAPVLAARNVKELLRSHSVSYAQGVQIALEARGIKAVLLDEQAPGYLGFAGRVRLAVGDDADYERAMAVVRALELPRSTIGPPRSWAWQRWGLIAGGTGFILLLGEVAVANTASRAVAVVLLALAIALMVTGLVLIAVGPSRDRPS